MASTQTFTTGSASDRPAAERGASSQARSSGSASSESQSRNKSADEIRHEMRQIRCEMGHNVEELVENAERLMDWRYYVKSYPWLSVGAAAVLGYLIVPRRDPVIDERRLNKAWERIVTDHPVVINQPHPAEQKKSTLMGSLMSMAANMAWKAALAYASQQAGKLLGQQAAGPSGKEQHHGTSVC